MNGLEPGSHPQASPGEQESAASVPPEGVKAPVSENGAAAAIAPDPLFTEDLPALLALFPPAALSAVMDILRAHSSWTPFPMPVAAAARQAGPDEDLRDHAPEIAREILWWGSNDLKRQFGEATCWRDVLAVVAGEISVPKEERGAGCVAVERAILRRRLPSATAKSPGILRRAVAWAGRAAQIAGPEVGRQAGRIAMQSAGAVLPSAGAAAAEGGAAAAVGGGLASAGEIAALANPVGISITAAAAIGAIAWHAAGPAARVLVPIAEIVAATRQSMRDARMAESFGA